MEEFNTPELHDHEVTVSRSSSRYAMAAEESMPITKRARLELPPDAGFTKSTEERNEAFPLIPSLPTTPTDCAQISSSRGEDFHDVTSCPKLEPKHKIFLSHSGYQKPFVEQLCKDLEAQNQFPFFDQRSDSLPLGVKFSTLIIDAAKQCLVAVVVLSREYLRSKWPMLELVEFVRARRSSNKNLKLFPLFYKASVDDLSDKSIQNEWMPRWKELVGGDDRVNLEEWTAAVRELRGVNGPRFDKFGNSEVKYRDAIVEGIFMLAPPQFLFDTSKIVGRDRICEILAGMFLPHTRTSAHVLGLYGMGGLGKTSISKSLCNHFNQQFSGRVCYIEIKEGVGALERQKMVMRKLLGSHEMLLQRLCDVSEGWSFVQSRMKEHAVFLVIDNVQSDAASKEEARKYLEVEYTSGSKIMVISRSADVVEDLLGDQLFCHGIPCLTMEEAAAVFLQQAAPLLDYSSLTWDERTVVRRCIENAWFSRNGPRQTDFWSGNQALHYHPLSLIALGVFIHGKSKASDLLSWKSHLPEYMIVKDTTESYKHIFKLLGLQFSSLDRTTQLMFLDLCLYASHALETRLLSNSPLEDLVAWLAVIHEEPTEVIRSKIIHLKNFAMISVVKVYTLYYFDMLEVVVHDLYKEYATWVLGQVNRENEVLGVWCVGKGGVRDGFLPLELVRTPPGRCWPELKRIRLENLLCEGFLKGKVQEWCNVVVLQIVGCENLTTINLQGLACLRHLELKRLYSLKIVSFTGDGSTSSTSGVSQESFVEPRQLQFVIIDELPALQCLPSFSLFTALRFLKVVKCEGLTQPPCIQHCIVLERLCLWWYPNQGTLPSLWGLTSLQDLAIHGSIQGYRGETLKLEGLSSLISLGALELCNIPVEDLSGLENLTRLEFIKVLGVHHLTCLPPLNNLAKSSLHVLELSEELVSLEGLNELNLLMKHKLEGLAALGEIVPHTPSKIREPMKMGRWVAEVRVSRMREKIWLGSYMSEWEAALALDAALHHCTLKRIKRYHFEESPQNLGPSQYLNLIALPREDRHNRVKELAINYATSYRPSINLPGVGIMEKRLTYNMRSN